MNEELRIQRVKQYGSFLYCPMRGNLCFGRYTDKECSYDSCILDDPEYQKQKKIIEENRQKQSEETEKEDKQFIPPSRPANGSNEREAWKEVYQKEAMARKLYKKNKPKIADGLMADALYMRRQLAMKRGEVNERD